MSKINWYRATQGDDYETRERTFGDNSYRSFGFYKTKSAAIREKRMHEGLLHRITKVKGGYVLWVS